MIDFADLYRRVKDSHESQFWNHVTLKPSEFIWLYEEMQRLQKTVDGDTSAMKTEENLVNRLIPWEGRALDAEAQVKVLKDEVAKLKHLLTISEDYRKAYQDGKYELYAMGGAICEAAAKHLPMSEGPLDRACRAALAAPAAAQTEEK